MEYRNRKYKLTKMERERQQHKMLMIVLGLVIVFFIGAFGIAIKNYIDVKRCSTLPISSSEFEQLNCREVLEFYSGE